MLERIRVLRVQNNFSQRALASRINASQKSVDNWEKGVAEPSAVAIAKLADIFGCSADYILGREDEFGQVNINSNLTEEEKQLLVFYNACGKKEKSSIINFARYLSEKQM